MGGIAAIVHFDGRPADVAALGRMTAAMDYRGPDGISHWNAGPAALGHCAMHSTAEAREAQQPCCDEDESLILLLDGYIGNHEELRHGLLERRTALRNRSDAELLLRAYQEWGESCLAHVEGEFALVIWDVRRQALFCGRDHQGLRPLFWHRDRDRLLVASDFAALREVLGDGMTPNEGVLVQMMAHQWYFREETVWKDVQRVLAAHTTLFTAQGMRLGRYWSLPAPYSIRHASDGEYAEHYREVLIEAVRRASRSDGKAGFEVSGGLDSSAVFAIGDKLAGENALQAHGMAGFALAGPPGSGADEVEFIEAVAGHLGRPVHRVPLFIPELDWFLDQARRDADIPYYPNAAMLAGMYREMAGDGCRIALNGLGGDEWLNGRPSQFHESLVHRDWPLLGRALAATRAAHGTWRTSRLFWHFGMLPAIRAPLKSVLRGLDPRLASGSPPPTPWLSDRARQMLADRKADYDRLIAGSDMPEHRLRMLTLPMNAMAVEHASRLRAECGIEGRHPLLSRSFIAFSAATPEATRLRGSRRKYTHRQALKGMLPDKVIERDTKAEFSAVLDPHVQAITKFLEIHGKDQLNGLLSGAGPLIVKKDGKRGDVDTIRQVSLWGVLASAAILS